MRADRDGPLPAPLVVGSAAPAAATAAAASQPAPRSCIQLSPFPLTRVQAGRGTRLCPAGICCRLCSSATLARQPGGCTRAAGPMVRLGRPLQGKTKTVLIVNRLAECHDCTACAASSDHTVCQVCSTLPRACRSQGLTWSKSPVLCTSIPF